MEFPIVPSYPHYPHMLTCASTKCTRDPTSRHDRRAAKAERVARLRPRSEREKAREREREKARERDSEKEREREREKRRERKAKIACPLVHPPGVK